MRFTKAICLTFLMSASITAGTTIPGQAQTTQLIFNSYLPPFNTTHQVGVVDFAARIEEESDGTIDIIIPDATLAPDDRQYEMLADRIADMGFIPTGSVSQMVVLNAIADLPFNAPTAEAASVAIWETYNEYFKDFDEYAGVKLLSAHVLTGRQILSIDRPVENAADLEGMKIWTSPGALTDVGESFGAVPVITQFAEVPEYVSKRNVDGLLMTPGSAGPLGILPDIQHMTTVRGGVGSVSFAVAISDTAWKRLTPEQQDAVLRAAEGLPRRTGAVIDEGEERAKPKMGHITVVEADDEMADQLENLIGWQVKDWKNRAAEKGLENPDEVLTFYKSILERETATQ